METAQRSDSRSVKVLALWTLLACASVGTYFLSHRIESRADGAASAFLATGARHQIVLTSGRASPTSVESRVGDEVLFLVKDSRAHNIAEERSSRRDARLESGEIGKDESYSLVFQTPGTYSFYDRMDQDIHVSIVVR